MCAVGLVLRSLGAGAPSRVGRPPTGRKFIDDNPVFFLFTSASSLKGVGIKRYYKNNNFLKMYNI